MPKSMLLCFAHPDDESFGSGALIAKYSAEGVGVTLICATSGDVGTVDPVHLAGHDSISALRLTELECAAKVLGIKEVVTFGYRDSGMMGSADNQHPQSLWQAPLEEVTARVVEVIRRVRPQVVVTFDPFGGYGHPDHIKIHQATVAAFGAVQADAEHPQKLYYMALPRLMLKIAVWLLRLTGKDPRRLGTNKDLDLEAVANAVLPTHARIDVSRYYEVGQRAASCHASQANPGSLFPLARVLMRWAAATAPLTRVEPRPVPGEPPERDLFAGTR